MIILALLLVGLRLKLKYEKTYVISIANTKYLKGIFTVIIDFNYLVSVTSY